VKSSDELKKVKVEPGNVVVLTDFGKKPEKNCGRPNCLSEEKLEELLSVYYSKPYSLRRLAEMFGVSRMTVWRAVQENQGYVLSA
jgi:predicted DNA-binding protein (UPF0251 family)